jgi:hypothetical protein
MFNTKEFQVRFGLYNLLIVLGMLLLILLSGGAP